MGMNEWNGYEPAAGGVQSTFLGWVGRGLG